MESVLSLEDAIKEDAIKLPYPSPVVWSGRILGNSIGCARGHHSDGPKANHALTFKLDHSLRAPQSL